MDKFIYGLFSLLILIFLSISLFLSNSHVKASSSPGKFALLVGISKYDRGRGPGKDWANLHCTNDVNAMENILVNKFGFLKKDILILTDENATYERILKGFKEHLINNAKPGDVIVFQFSGHGQQIPDDDGDEPDGKDESLVPYDYGISGAPRPETIKENLRMRDDEIEKLISELKNKMKDDNGKVAGDVFVILDSCCSGTATRGIVTSRGRGWDEKLDGPEPQGKETAETRTFIRKTEDYIFLSACKSYQSAMEDDECQMGVLTRYLIEALNKAGPDTTYRGLYERLNLMVKSDAWQQDPQMECNGDKLLFSGNYVKSRDYLLSESPEDNIIKLPGGKIHGITKGSIYAVYRSGSDVSDNKNKIGEGEVISVDLSSSLARITTGNLKKDALSASRAVEIAHNYENIMTVYMENNKDIEEIIKNLKFINSGSKEHYDVKIYGDKNMIILERKDGTLIGKIENTGNAGQEVNRKLLMEWKKRFFTGLTNNDGNSSVKLDIRPGKIKVNQYPDRIEEVGQAEYVKPDKYNNLIFYDGDWIFLEVRNSSVTPLYVNILALDSEGNISPIFPNPDIAFADIEQAKLNIVPNDGKWHRIPVCENTSIQKDYNLCLCPPFGTELIKVIATKEPVNFSPLIHESTVANKGDELTENFKGDLNPLAFLLYDTNDGGNRGKRKPVKTSYWGTADFVFEIKEKK